MEIKNSPAEPGFDADHRIAVEVAAALEGLSADRRSRLIVSSFNLATLDAFHAAIPSVPTGWLTGPGWDQVAAVASAAAGGHTALNPADAAVTPEVVGAAHAAGLEVVVWTVDDPSRMTVLAGLGVDVLVTDRPIAAAATLARHPG